VSNLLDKISKVDGDKVNLIKVVNDKIQEVVDIRDLVLDDLERGENYRNDLIKKVTDLEVEIIRNESHIKVQNKNLEQIQEDVKTTIQRLNLEELEVKNYELSKKVKYLEEVFEKFNEKEIITENIIVEPPSTDNKDPLTPLDKNYVTLDQLQQHYRLFVNRVQQQLATIGGGGETRLEFLDDVDRNSAKINGYVLQYDSSVGKFIGTSYVPGGGGNVAIAITDTAPTYPTPGNHWYDLDIGRTFIYYQDNDSSQWVDVAPSGTSVSIPNYWISTNAGIHTTLNVGIGTTNPTTKLDVRGGDIRVGINTSEGVILTSPNGTKYRLIVSDSGTLSTVFVP
jgi:hypothetical protein